MSARAVARWMRRIADRIDHRGAPKALGWSFTFEDKQGIRFRDDGRGCRLWYLGDDDYTRAHSEADTDHAIVDWSSRPLRVHLPSERRP